MLKHLFMIIMMFVATVLGLEAQVTRGNLGRTDIVGAYQGPEAIASAYKAGYLEFYAPRDFRGKGVNAPDGKNILAAPMSRLAFAELQVLGGRVWVAIKPTDIVRRRAGSETPFALDACGNRIYRIMYPDPLPEAVSVSRSTEEEVTVVNNTIVLPQQPAPVVVERKGKVVINNRIIPPAAPVGPVVQAPVFKAVPPPIVAPSSDMGPHTQQISPLPITPYQPAPYAPVAKKGWSTGKKVLIGIGIAGGAYLLTKAFKKEDKKAGPPSGSTLGEGGAPSGGTQGSMSFSDAAMLHHAQRQAFKPGFNQAEFAAANGRGVYISIGRRF